MSQTKFPMLVILVIMITTLSIFPMVAKGQEIGDGVGVRGVVTPTSRVNISTELVAPIQSMPFLEGARFSKDDILVAFDCGRYAADLRAAKASANAAWVELKQKRYLLKHGATGRSEVDLASAQSARAGAEIDAIEERMRSCEIKAPFSGRVVQVNAREAELPSGNEPLLTIVDDSKIEIELVVPSRWLRVVRLGTVFDFEVDETGDRLTAVVDRLGAEVDPVSQTIRIYATINQKEAFVLAGMSGDAIFPAQTDTENQTSSVQ